MLTKLYDWVRNQEPVAAAAVVFAAVAVAGQSVADLSADASWTAVVTAAVLGVLRHFVSPAGKTDG